MNELIEAIFRHFVGPSYRTADRWLRRVLLFLLAWPLIMATVSKWAPQFVTSLVAFGPLVALAWLSLYVVGPVIVGGAAVFSATARGLLTFVLALAAVESAIGIYFTMIPVYTWNVIPLAFLVMVTLFLVMPGGMIRTVRVLPFVLIPLLVWLLFLAATTEEQRLAWWVWFGSLRPSAGVVLPSINPSNPWLLWGLALVTFLGLLWLMPTTIRVAAVLLALVVGAFCFWDTFNINIAPRAQAPSQSAYVTPQTREYNELVRRTPKGSMVEYKFAIYPGQTVGFDVSFTGQRWHLHRFTNNGGRTILTFWDHRWNMIYHGPMGGLNNETHGSYLDIMLTRASEPEMYQLSIWKDIDPFAHGDRVSAR